ncbi:MAG TPA: hypothetical protein VFN09_00770 [Rhodanobacteraceae bacterium]|nr:hypothetical protein [Rhodanobacteraceae bacterium]
MKCHQTVLTGGIAAALLLVSDVSMATMQTSHASTTTYTTNAVNASVLYDQTTGASGEGAPTQDFEVGYDSYDSAGADDFVVPAPGWSLTEINVTTSFSVTITSMSIPVNISIYPDAGGAPGTSATCTYSAITATADPTLPTNVVLPTPCYLPPGTYWMSFQAIHDFGGTPGGQVFWSTRTIQSGSQGQWQNPGDGFGSGCTTWGTLTACAVAGNPGSNSVDYMFQLMGTVLADPPVQSSTPVPTIGTWAGLFGGAGLALLAFLGLRRRENLG